MYVFEGDYVDRGPKGVEIVLLLVALKLIFPHFVVILRGIHCLSCSHFLGNHESKDVCRSTQAASTVATSFEEEIKLKFPRVCRASSGED